MSIQYILIPLIIAGAFYLWKGKRSFKQVLPNGFKPAWEFRWSKGMPAGPTAQGSGWTFDFPTDPAHNVNHVAWIKAPSLVGKTAITMRFAVTGGGFVPWESPASEALVSIIIQRKGDNMTALGVYEAYRQYSGAAIPLAPGSFELTVPLTSTDFGGVMNSHDAAAFRATLANAENIGVIFGYNGGRAHGVYATQPSTFQLYRLEPVG